MDQRHLRRMKIVQELYAQSFDHAQADRNLRSKTRAVIVEHDVLNKYIVKYAPKFPLDKIAKVDKAILLLSIYELVFEKKEPAKVIINEAIELAKELGSERSFAFVNAVLAKVYQDVYGK